MSPAQRDRLVTRVVDIAYIVLLVILLSVGAEWDSFPHGRAPLQPMRLLGYCFLGLISIVLAGEAAVFFFGWRKLRALLKWLLLTCLITAAPVLLICHLFAPLRVISEGFPAHGVEVVLRHDWAIIEIAYTNGPRHLHGRTPWYPFSIALPTTAGLRFLSLLTLIVWREDLAGHLSGLNVRLCLKAPDPRFCWECNYDLTGNISGICPECGHAITAQVPGQAVS